MGLTILQYDCKMMELEGLADDQEFKFTAEQAENLETMQKEIEDWNAEAELKA